MIVLRSRTAQPIFKFLILNFQFKKFIKGVLRAYLFFLRMGGFPAVTQVLVHKTGFTLICELDGKHIYQFLS